MTSCPCGDISQEPDRNNKSLLTVYLMASCSRLTCTLSAASSFFRVAISAELCAACAVDDCCSVLYCPCSVLCCPCSVLYCPCSAVYLPSSSLYLPFETQPDRRTEATQSRNRTLRCRLNVIIVRSPSSAGKTTLLP